MDFYRKKENEFNKNFKIFPNYIFLIVIFIPAIKINFYLNSFKNYFPNRKLMIAKEITKIHETYYRDSINNFKLFKSPLKGELTVVISEKNTKKNLLTKKNC